MLCGHLGWRLAPAVRLLGAPLAGIVRAVRLGHPLSGLSFFHQAPPFSWRTAVLAVARLQYLRVRGVPDRRGIETVRGFV